MARVCVFCGEGGLTKEHAWPKWLIELLSPTPDDDVIHELIDSDKKVVRRHRTSGLGAFVRQVCASCNNGWMGSLETSSQGDLTSLIQGQSTRLTPSSQVGLTRWLVKTGMMLDLSIHEQSIPVSLYHSFYATKEPPDHMAAWLSSFEPAALAPILAYHTQVGPLFGDFRRAKPMNLVGMERIDCYLQTVKIGCLVGQILWANNREFVEYAVRSGGSDEHTNLWPDPHVADWPTSKFEAFESFRAFSNRLYGWRTT